MAADFNGDGNIDLVTVSLRDAVTTGHLAVLVGKGDGTFRPARIYPTPIGPNSNLVAADFNGDGAVDLAFALAVPNSNIVASSSTEATEASSRPTPTQSGLEQPHWP